MLVGALYRDGYRPAVLAGAMAQPSRFIGQLNTRCLDLRWMPQHSDRVCSVFISRLAGRCAGSVESKSPRIASRCTSPGSTRVQHVRTCPRHWCGGQKQPRRDPRGSRAMFLQSDSGASVWCLRSTQSRGRRNSCFAVAITASSRPGASACGQRPRYRYGAMTPS